MTTTSTAYFLFEGDKLVAQFEGPGSMGDWLLRHRDTHDYELVNGTFYLRFREPWRLERASL